MTRTGWQCPRCGRVWAPDVSSCTPCNLTPAPPETPPVTGYPKRGHRLWCERCNDRPGGCFVCR